MKGRALAPFAAILAYAAGAAGAPVGRPSPRIVNGTPTSSFAAVGALLEQDPADPTLFGGLCSGTLIGCHTFITAAHCVCPEDTDNAQGCLAEGTTDPATLRVVFQNGGVRAVESVAIDPDYSFAEHGDAAVVRLTAPMSGIAPAPINRSKRVPLGSRGLIVGFGSTGGPPFLASDYGVKRQGLVTTATCPNDVTESAHVCWHFDGTDSSTCMGDSGGPFATDLGDGLVLAGLTSGGESFSCEPPDEVFDTDVFVVRDWIDAQLASDTTASCGDLPAVGDSGAATKGGAGNLSQADPSFDLTFNVPAGTRLLRVVLNAQEFGGAGFQRQANDIDLFVGTVGAAEFTCTDDNPSVYGDCEIASPQAGDWHAQISLVDGDGGTAQLTVTTFAANLRGDANCDDKLSAPDVIALTSLLGQPPPCPNADADGSGVMDPADLPLIVSGMFQ